MWVFTTIGYFSVVQDSDDASKVRIRARVSEDIEALRPYVGVVEPVKPYALSDYPYRMIVDKDVWAKALNKLASEIDYCNFKDTIKEVQGKERASIYAKVWSVMLHLQTVAGLYTAGRFGPSFKNSYK